MPHYLGVSGCSISQTTRVPAGAAIDLEGKVRRDEAPSLLFPLSLWARGPDCWGEERCHDDSQWPLEPCNLTCLQEPSPGHNHLVTSKSRLHKVSERCWTREQIWPMFGYLLLSVPLTLSYLGLRAFHCFEQNLSTWNFSCERSHQDVLTLFIVFQQLHLAVFRDSDFKIRSLKGRCKGTQSQVGFSTLSGSLDPALAMTLKSLLFKKCHFT